MKKSNRNKNNAQLQQKGFSTIAVLSFMVMLGAGAYVGIKLVPSYLDYLVISQAMDEAVKVDSVGSLRSKQIVNLVRSKMGPSATAPDIDLNAITSVVVRDGLKVVKLNYEVVVPVVKNASALIHYTHEATVQQSANTAQSRDAERQRLMAAN